MAGRSHWDIFCAVVDNYGDAGIGWRLARQLADEHGLAVRLWIDDLATLARIRPEIDPRQALQRLCGVEIRHWPTPFPAADPGEVVIEALGCHLPAGFEAAMAQRRPAPLWINLEHLSAEDWVIGYHRMPSPHPRLGLVKWFFMPGYVAGSGGLLRESGLTAARLAFQADPNLRQAFWRDLGLPPETGGETRVSLFSYFNPRLDDLCAAWAAGPLPTRLIRPLGEGPVAAPAVLGGADLRPGGTLRRGALTLHTPAMLDQEAYDRLLWACDVNFVRGEDSWVRAQWAAAPFVWQAYVQPEDAHWAKIEAFLARYCEGLEAAPAQSLREFWRWWNGGGSAIDPVDSWTQLLARMTRLRAHGAAWVRRLEGLGDLAGNLARFVAERRATED